MISSQGSKGLFPLKRIFIYSEDFPRYSGGIAQWAAGIATSLHGLGRDIAVFTRYRPELPPSEAPQWPFSVEYIVGRHWKQWRTLYYRRALKESLKKKDKPRLIIATTWNVARGLIRLCRRHGIDLVVVAHALEVTRTMPALKKQWLAMTMRAASKVVCVSHFTKERLLAKVALHPERVVVLPNGVNAEVFQPDIETRRLRQTLGIAPDEKIILTLARVIERKGHDTVLRALPIVLNNVPRVKYLVVGPREEAFYQRLLTLVSELGLDHHVLFQDFVALEELPTYYNLCDVYIMPSRELKEKGDTEGFGITYLEANACGKPVIGGDSGGVGDAIADGESGYLVDPLDAEGIAAKLLYLLKHAEEAERMGRYGRKRVEEAFTWDAIAVRLLDAINEKG